MLAQQPDADVTLPPLPQSGSGVTVAPLPPALLLLVQDAAARTTGRGRFVTLLRVPRAPLAASTRGGGGS